MHDWPAPALHVCNTETFSSCSRHSAAPYIRSNDPFAKQNRTENTTEVAKDVKWKTQAHAYSVNVIFSASSLIDWNSTLDR